MKRWSLLALVAAVCVLSCARMKESGAGAAPAAPPPPPPPPPPEALVRVEPTIQTDGSLPLPPGIDEVQRHRLVVYNAFLALVVDNVRDALDHVKTTAEEAGGYMEALDADSITVRVPAAKFHDVIAAVEKIGRVTRREIKGTDVTDKVRDLHIRLQNAEEMRTRLVALLEKADKVEDALQIERELGRITETIELLKGQIQVLERDVALSVVSVQVNSPVPQQVIRQEVPFPWVRDLGAEMAVGRSVQPGELTDRKGIPFTLPDSFAKYHETDSMTRATSAEGVLIKVTRQEGTEGADLEFWARLAERSLTAQHAIAVKGIDDITLDNNVPAKLVQGTKQVGGETFGYLVALIVSKNYVVAYEAWGPQEAFSATRNALDQSIRSVNVRPSFWKRSR